MQHIDPGKLDQRVTIEVAQGTQDDYGQRVVTWVPLQPVPTVWARVWALRGREFFAAAQVQQERSIKVLMRYRADVTEQMRLVWRGVAYDITGIVPLDGGTEWFEIMALSGVRDGK